MNAKGCVGCGILSAWMFSFAPTNTLKPQQRTHIRDFSTIPKQPEHSFHQLQMPPPPLSFLLLHISFLITSLLITILLTIMPHHYHTIYQPITTRKGPGLIIPSNRTRTPTESHAINVRGNAILISISVALALMFICSLGWLCASRVKRARKEQEKKNKLRRIRRAVEAAQEEPEHQAEAEAQGANVNAKANSASADANSNANVSVHL
jgi:hypothetical protein